MSDGTKKPEFVKNFNDWFELKPKLDTKSVRPPLFDEGQVWWCHCGENIGTEISGKGEDFLRPFLVLTKLDKYSFVGIPLSTKTKKGSWYFKIYFKNINQILLLNQLKFLDYKRIHFKLGEITSQEFQDIKNALKNLLKL